MKLLVVSDIFYDLIESDSIDYAKWSEPHLLAMRGYDCILVDLTFEQEKKKPAIIESLFTLKDIFEKKNFLSRNNLVVVIVCATPTESLKKTDKEEKEAIDSIYAETQPFGIYDFLKALTTGSNRIEFDVGRHVYSVSQFPISLYFQQYKDGPTYLSYDYDLDHEDCIDIVPLARMKRTSRACVAYECRQGRGVVVVLPSYRIDDREHALSILSKICKSYFKRNEGVRELIEKYVDSELPETIRPIFTEALICFSYDLYAASLLMCRKALEESVHLKGAKGRQFLRRKIKILHKRKIIDDNLKDVAVEVVEFGNWGAHASKFRGKQIVEDDVMNAIEFLQIYFDSVHVIPAKLQRSAKRRNELKDRR
jgi:hypothetical protein